MTADRILDGDGPSELLRPVGTLVDGADVDAALESDDEQELLSVWRTYQVRQACEAVLSGHDRSAIVTRILDTTAGVTALQALTANRRLGALLATRSWAAAHAARQAGCSWSELREALGDYTKEGARQWYLRSAHPTEAVAAPE